MPFDERNVGSLNSYLQPHENLLQTPHFLSSPSPQTFLQNPLPIFGMFRSSRLQTDPDPDRPELSVPRGPRKGLKNRKSRITRTERKVLRRSRIARPSGLGAARNPRRSPVPVGPGGGLV